MASPSFDETAFDEDAFDPEAFDLLDGGDPPDPEPGDDAGGPGVGPFINWLNGDDDDSDPPPPPDPDGMLKAMLKAMRKNLR